MSLVRCRVYLATFILFFGVKSFAIFAPEEERARILETQDAEKIKKGFMEGLWPGYEKGYQIFLSTGYELFDIIDLFPNPDSTFSHYLEHFKASHFSNDVRIKILQVIDKLGNSSKVTANLKEILDTDLVHPDNILELLIQLRTPQALFQDFLKDPAEEVIMQFLLKNICDIDKHKNALQSLRESILLDLKKPHFFSFLNQSRNRNETIKKSMRMLLKYHEKILNRQASVPNLIEAFDAVNFDGKFIKSTMRLLDVVERPDQFLIALYQEKKTARKPIVETLRKTAKRDSLEFRILSLHGEWWDDDAQKIISMWPSYRRSLN